jgi:hypothetical protein
VLNRPGRARTVLVLSSNVTLRTYGNIRLSPQREELKTNRTYGL